MLFGVPREPMIAKDRVFEVECVQEFRTNYDELTRMNSISLLWGERDFAHLMSFLNPCSLAAHGTATREHLHSNSATCRSVVRSASIWITCPLRLYYRLVRSHRNMKHSGPCPPLLLPRRTTVRRKTTNLDRLCKTEENSRPDGDPPPLRGSTS
jgi:hypothetical protein